MRRPAVATVLLVGLVLAAASGCDTWRGGQLYAKGTDALEAGDAAAAIAALERAAELVPRSAEVQNHLGIAYLQAGHPEAARRAFARAVALNCSDPAAAINLERLEARRARSAAAGAEKRRAGPVSDAVPPPAPPPEPRAPGARAVPAADDAL